MTLAILQHALGLDRYGRLPDGERESRNHYVAEESSHDFAACAAHVEAGRMARHGPSYLYGGDDCYCFVVTDTGRSYVREHSPKPPKKTPGQRRYEEWLRISDAIGVSFGEWLKQGGTPCP